MSVYRAKGSLSGQLRDQPRYLLLILREVGLQPSILVKVSEKGAYVSHEVILVEDRDD